MSNNDKINKMQKFFQKVKLFLSGDNGVLIKKTDWDNCKSFLMENLSETQKLELKELNIIELELWYDK